MPGNDASGSELELLLGAGRVLRIGPGFDEPTLRRLLAPLGGGGTLFIDEIAEKAAGLQAKLLLALEDGHYRRVGPERLIRQHEKSARSRPRLGLHDSRRVDVSWNPSRPGAETGMHSK